MLARSSEKYVSRTLSQQAPAVRTFISHTSRNRKLRAPKGKGWSKNGQYTPRSGAGCQAASKTPTLSHYAGWGKSRFIVMSTQNTEFILILSLAKYGIIFL